MNEPSARGEPGRRAAALACLGAAWSAVALGCGPAGREAPPAPEEPRDAPAAAADPQVEENLASFDQVWTTVRDRHYDPELLGLDWEAVRDELRPRVAAAATVEEARAVLSEMLGRLGQSHFAIFAGTALAALGPGEAGGGEVGMELLVSGDAVLVARVRDGGPAARAGVRPGWLLVRVDGDEVAAVVAELDQTFAESTLRELVLCGAIEGRLAGEVGSVARVELLDGRGEKVQLEISREEPAGAMAGFGHLPPLPLRYESRRVGKDVGYIAFSAFLDPARIMGSFTADLAGFHGARGVVLDLRGNPGGLAGMAMGVGGWFVTERGKSLGTMITRDTRFELVVNPQERPYRGKLAVLIDGRSASTAEILAAGLQDLERARLFGGRTAGAALPSMIDRLPNGDGFQYAIGNYVSAGGQVLEGRGVEPDVGILPAREQLLAGKDPVLDAAVAWIRER